MTDQYTLSEEKYEEILARIRKGAELLSNPLLDEETREKYMRRYDALCLMIMQTKDYYKARKEAGRDVSA
jgi:hypothetical protein